MNTQLDASIPVLTEIITPDTLTTIVEEIQSEHIGDITSEIKQPATQQGSISEEEWQLLEQTLRENVLKHVLTRVDFVLEHRVRDSLADVLQTAVEKLANEIRMGLKNSLEEVVTRAVTQEIAKVKTSK
ncbi:hypothetical protein [Undibacterium sp. RuRC25W]|uniref:hypothetical protein n=1 Tax=Undibacterium sp. RuRC25W TaxID=3413047 RepID=UPI003BEF6095